MNRILFVLIFLLGLLSACHSGDSSSSAEDEKCSSETCLVYAVFPESGIGDQGFLDLIYYGLNKAKDSLGFSLENAFPTSHEDAEKFIQRFFDESDSGNFSKRLLILTVDDYDSLFIAHKNWKQNSLNKILALEPTNSAFDAYFWDISLYGASYLAGRSVIKMGLDSANIIAANSQSEAVKNAVEGFIDGYEKGNGFIDSTDVFYIYNVKGMGFDSEVAYYYAINTNFFHSANFIFPIIGGSNLNLFRFMREKKDSVNFLTCGMDVNQQYLSDKIPFSINKRTDRFVLQFLTEWVQENIHEKNFEATLESEFIDITISDGYEDWEAIFKKFENEAIQAENKYWEEKWEN